MVEARLASVRAARRTTRELYGLFGRLGTAEHPRGQVLVAYRNAHRALRDAFGRGGLAVRLESREILGGLRRDVEAVARQTLREAVELGVAQADVELEAWGLPSAGGMTVDTRPMLTAWMATVEGQAAAAQAIIVGGGEPALIVGDASRAGLLHPATVVREGSRWLTTAALAGFVTVVQAPAGRSGIRWCKQAVAAIDERTTDCCLRVHAQSVPLDGKFRLTGEPRFADALEWPPFHWYCRTSVALVPADQAEDELTAQMREAARAELRARAETAERIREVQQRLAELGAAPDAKARADDTAEVTQLRQELKRLRLRPEIHPAHATSRRGASE